jgi:CRISPR-associated protein Cas2
MMVLILERVPTSLRGELTRWLLEPKAGVFVGRVSGMVRDKLWEKVCKSLDDRRSRVRGGEVDRGGGMLIYQSDTEQGFAIRYHGEVTREVVDFEGLLLIRIP